MVVESVRASKVSKGTLWAFYLFWGIPVAIFLVNPSYTQQPWPVWFAAGLTVIFSTIDQRFFAFAIPLAGMLSPLAESGRILGLLPSEMFVAVCGFWALVSTLGRGRFRLLPGDTYLMGLVCFVVFSYVLSFEYAALIPSVLNWIGLVVVFAITRISLQSSESARLYLVSLSVAAAYAAVLIVTGFLHGMPLANFLSDSKSVLAVQESPSFSFRASFFYTNVFYLIGIAAILGLIASISMTRLLYKIFAGGFVLFMVFTLLVMFAKTGLVALAISVFALILVALLTRTFVRRHLWLPQLAMVVLLSIFTWITLAQFEESASVKIDTSSLAARVDTALSSLHVIMRNPGRLAFGFGPDASTRGTSEAAEAARQSSEGTEGAIDSAYAAYLFEYGLGFLILFVLFGVHSLLRLFRAIRRTGRVDPLATALLVVTIFIYVAAISQVIGTSKVAWVIVQIFALIGAFLSEQRSPTLFRRSGYSGISWFLPNR